MENIPWKRILAVVGFVGAVVVLGYLLFIVFFQPTPVPEPVVTPGGVGVLPDIPDGGPVAPPESGPTGLPREPETITPSDTAEGGLTKTDPFTAEPALDPTIDGNAALYYQPRDGKFYRLGTDGSVSSLSDQTFYGVREVTWSPDNDRAVLEYPDGSNIVYNFATDTQVTLPPHWEAFSFSPEGDQLAFKSLGIDRDSRWLGVADSSGGNAQAVQPLGDNPNAFDVAWSPNKQVVATFREHSGADRQDVYFVGLNGENFRSLTAPGIGLQSEWSPSGEQLLFSTSSGLSNYKPQLWIADASGENIGANRRSIRLNTWADKCTFRGDTALLCAVPQNLPDGAGLAPGVARSIPDDIYEVDLATGSTKLLARPTEPVTAERLFLTGDQSTLLLEDSRTRRLYRISL